MSGVSLCIWSNKRESEAFLWRWMGEHSSEKGEFHALSLSTSFLSSSSVRLREAWNAKSATRREE